MGKYNTVVDQLKSLLEANPVMKKSLNESLKKAVNLSKNGDSSNNIPPLNKDLYTAIDMELNHKGWPETVEEYYEYLNQYVRMIPNES